MRLGFLLNTGKMAVSLMQLLCSVNLERENFNPEHAFLEYWRVHVPEAEYPSCPNCSNAWQQLSVQ